MTQVTSQALLKVGNVTGENMSLSLETTARKPVAGTGADVTWRGVVVGSRHRGQSAGGSGDRKSSVADSRRPCTTDDQ